MVALSTDRSVLSHCQGRFIAAMPHPFNMTGLGAGVLNLDVALKGAPASSRNVLQTDSSNE